MIIYRAIVHVTDEVPSLRSHSIINYPGIFYYPTGTRVVNI